jgi:hypothetical protein
MYFGLFDTLTSHVCIFSPSHRLWIEMMPLKAMKKRPETPPVNWMERKWRRDPVVQPHHLRGVRNINVSVEFVSWRTFGLLVALFFINFLFDSSLCCYYSLFFFIHFHFHFFIRSPLMRFCVGYPPLSFPSMLSLVPLVLIYTLVYRYTLAFVVDTHTQFAFGLILPVPFVDDLNVQFIHTKLVHLQ